MTRYKFEDGKKIKFTAEEEAQRDIEEQEWKDSAFDRAIANLRFKRNNLLNETDWWGASDNTMTDEQKKYRQNLRDLTNGLTTVKKIEKVVFPNKPE